MITPQPLPATAGRFRKRHNKVGRLASRSFPSSQNRPTRPAGLLSDHPIAFAKLSNDDTMDEEDESEDNATDFGNRSLIDMGLSKMFGGNDKPPKTKGTPQTVMRDLPITLPSLQVAVLRVPFPMSDADYTALTSSLTAFKGALVQTRPAGNEPEGDDPDESE